MKKNVQLISVFVFATQIVLSLLSKSEISSLYACTVGLSRTYLETPKTGFLTTWLKFSPCFPEVVPLVFPGEKRYVCDICQKRFAHQSDVKRHKITHTGIYNVNKLMQNTATFETVKIDNFHMKM